MFGVAQRDHAGRYDYAQEWIDAIKLIWSEREDFDFDGRYIKLKSIRAKPKPYGGSRPIIMNAGASSTGQAFAVKNCDAFFMQASRVSVAETAERVANVKELARQHGREISVYTVGVITCRPTMQEAEEYHRHCVVDEADWRAVDRLLAMRNITPTTVSPEEFARQRSQFAHGNSGLPIIGDPDHVARELIALSEAGLTGIAVSLVNYADELPYLCDEVLPRLARVGLREPV
jgi:alkanesulfonate monooxygenase SsuD/methylene tetrahydromethanopterin reductase-like flavin-dependent oxidoreductase (luciferase family)